jgi:hypothetical protein
MAKIEIVSVKKIEEDECSGGEDYYIVGYSDGNRREFTASRLTEHSREYLDTLCGSLEGPR